MEPSSSNTLLIHPQGGTVPGLTPNMTSRVKFTGGTIQWWLSKAGLVTLECCTIIGMFETPGRKTCTTQRFLRDYSFKIAIKIPNFV